MSTPLSYLHYMVSIIPPELPVIIFCNKRDVSGSLCTDKVVKARGLEVLLKGREWECVEGSVKEGVGVEEACKWLRKAITKR